MATTRRVASLCSSVFARLLLLLLPTLTFALAPVSLRAVISAQARIARSVPFVRAGAHMLVASDDDSSGSGLELSQPTQAESEAMGLRDWPSTVVTQGGRSAYDADIEDGSRRYVLEGRATVRRDTGEALVVEPNTMVTVRGEVGGALRWELEEGVDELVLLTPEYKGPPLLPVMGGFLVTFAALIAVAGGG